MTGGISAAIRVNVAHFPPAAAAVPDVRTSTVRTLTRWSVDPDDVDAAEVVVCELASNAVKASRPNDVVAVRLTATSGSVLIEVWDGNDAGPRITNPDTDREDGRGLLMVSALSTRWSWYRTRTGGKVVWAQLPATMTQSIPACSTTALTTRTPTLVPAPASPVTFGSDPAVLQRVIDRLRGLDDWHRPPPGHGVRDQHHSGTRHRDIRPEAARR